MSSARRPSPASASHSPPPPPPLNSTSPSSSSTTTTTTSHHSPPMSDEDDGGLPPTSTNTNPTTPPSPSPSPPPPPSSSADIFPPHPPPRPSTTTKATSFPIREDCWSEDATHTLIEAWGSHYLDLNRGNLRQKHWQEVADAVNADHAHTKKLHRTDIQCKNRIDTLKKKYKLEKAKFLQSNGRVVSTWPFFASLDSLIGDSFIKANAPPSGTPPVTRKNSLAAKNTSPSPAPASAPATMTVRKEFPVLPPLPSAVPVGPRSKRPAPAPAMGEEAVFRRNFSAMAAAAAAVAEDDEDEEESDTSSAAAVGLGSGGMRRKKRRGAAGKVAAEGYRKLAEAIRGFADIYERVEEAKQRQMVELEKQRMQFAKDLEIQRMKLFMESQVQLEKLKRSKRNSQSGDGYL
ncbi:uncharacterized protein [Coffea arabica]|uniref:Myb/SANT-like DNA-binding domain-containing protein n=1 Tax=Coffea arabica TaxID=13443 RepID=A0A6P6XHN3_COFAR|nr:trihelix transcription factor ASIL2-like [Coffea arabica]